MASRGKTASPGYFPAVSGELNLFMEGSNTPQSQQKMSCRRAQLGVSVMKRIHLDLPPSAVMNCKKSVLYRFSVSFFCAFHDAYLDLPEII